MYSKEEAKKIKLDFWKAFDTYCTRDPLLRAKQPTWMLYRTGIKHMELKFDIDADSVIVALEVNHKNEGRRLDMFEALEPYRVLLQDGLSPLTWDFAQMLPSGKEVGRVYLELLGKNYKRISDWEEIFEFMCLNMISLESNFLDIRDTLKADLQNKFSS